MAKFLLRIVIYAIAIEIAAAIMPGIRIVRPDLGTVLILGLIFGLVNAFIKPILTLLTCPFVILTLGLFVFVINGVLLLITARLSDGRLIVDGLGWAILGGIVMGIVSVILELLVGLKAKA